MEVLAFNVSGKFAHFRNFYANSSALTYYIPPRTTIVGMIAGILGLEKDSYYEEFDLLGCEIGIKLVSKVKKLVQTLNYLMIKSSNDLNGSQENHTQIPFEFLSPLNINGNKDFVTFKIYYMAKSQENKQHFLDLKRKLLEKNEIHYPTVLGTANFTAFIDKIQLFNKSNIKVIKTEDFIQVDSAVIKENISDFKMLPDYHIKQETIPLEFNKDRYLKTPPKEVLFDLNCQPLQVKTNSEVISLISNKLAENIMFLK